jgi:hypothetical protein
MDLIRHPADTPAPSLVQTDSAVGHGLYSLYKGVDDNASMALAELLDQIKDAHVSRRVRLRGIVARPP